MPAETNGKVEPSGGVRRLTGALAGAVGRILAWRELARARRALAALDRAALKDVGLTACDAYAESAKPFWRA